MTPVEFARQFRAAVSAHAADLEAAWDKKRSRTSLMYGIIDGVAEALGVQVCLNPRQVKPREHYKLDAVFYDGSGPRYDGNQYVWRMDAAIEVENEARSSVIEMNKLVLFNTPLKVLVTYPKPAAVRQLLAEFADIARRGDAFGDFATLRRHLVILGMSPRQWTYYEYDGRAFSGIDPEHRPAP